MASKIERQTFSVGERVMWKSQAGGYCTMKEGVVRRVIDAGEPCHITHEELTKFSCQVDSQWSRDHENYLVVVPGKTERAKGKIYRPVVSKLHKVVVKTYVDGV